MSYDKDFSWQHKFVPEIKRHLAQHLITEAPIEEDRHHNTDFIVLNMKSVRIACRLRHHEYLKKFGDEFTIRTIRPSGAPTEIHKLMSGWGDYIFYGFADSQDLTISKWVLGDLNVFRPWYSQQQKSLPPNVTPGPMYWNKDGSSALQAISTYQLPRNFVIASGGGG